jgi:hypothetical protein
MGLLKGLGGMAKGLFAGGDQMMAAKPRPQSKFLNRLGSAVDGIGAAQAFMNGNYGAGMDFMAQQRKRRNLLDKAPKRLRGASRPVSFVMEDDQWGY